MIGRLFAQHAAVALMMRDSPTEQQAFDRLAHASQHANIKLVDVAQWVVTTMGRP